MTRELIPSFDWLIGRTSPAAVVYVYISACIPGRSLNLSIKMYVHISWLYFSWFFWRCDLSAIARIFVEKILGRKPRGLPDVWGSETWLDVRLLMCFEGLSRRMDDMYQQNAFWTRFVHLFTSTVGLMIKKTWFLYILFYLFRSYKAFTGIRTYSICRTKRRDMKSLL